MKTITTLLRDGVPEGTTIQFLDYASPHIGYFIDSWKASRNLEKIGNTIFNSFSAGRKDICVRTKTRTINNIWKTF